MQSTKTLILGSKNRKEQAILNLRHSQDSDIKFFNFNSQNKNFALGIKQGNEVKKIPLIIKNNLCKFILPKSLDLQRNILCAVVDVSNAFCPEIVLSGSNNTTIENATIEEHFVTKKPEDTSVLYTQDSLEDINTMIDKNLQEDLNCTYFDACSTCKYREAFYNVQETTSNNSTSTQENSSNNIIAKQENSSNNIIAKQENPSNNIIAKQENPSNTINMQTKNIERLINEQTLNNFDNNEIGNNKDEEPLQTFYLQIKPQIDALFNKYSQYLPLSTIVANSKWAKINYDNGKDFYVLGLIFNNNQEVEFISYGVPSQDDQTPPEDIKEFAQWLQVPGLEENFKGFWLVYQNAQNGETVKVDYN